MVRHVSQHQLTFWLVTHKSYTLKLQLYQQNDDLPFAEITLDDAQHQKIQLGAQAVVNLLSINFSSPLPLNTLLSYNFTFIDVPRAIVDRANA